MVGLPFSGPLAGDGIGGLLVRVSLPVLVRYLCHHANGFYARQPQHPPSTYLEALKVEKSRLEAESRQPNFQTAVIQILWFGATVQGQGPGAALCARSPAPQG